MTVAELIERLQAVEDKSMPVVESFDIYGDGEVYDEMPYTSYCLMRPRLYD